MPVNSSKQKDLFYREDIHADIECCHLLDVCTTTSKT